MDVNINIWNGSEWSTTCINGSYYDNLFVQYARHLNARNHAL